MTVTRSRLPLFAALVIGVSSVAVIAYFILANPRGEALPASGGHYAEGVTRAPDRMNPLFSAASATDADVASLVFSGLVQLGPDATPRPDLAERWEITGNGQDYLFHLRRGVEWHDGQPFSADDVVFTYRAMADPAFKGDPALHDLMKGVTVTARDPLTVEFKLEEAYAPFLAHLTTGILPQHLLDGLDPNQLFNAPFNAQPVGTGPYEFRSSDEHSVTLVTNPTYYLGPPRISTFEFKVYNDNAGVLAALRQREIDGALLAPGTAPAELDVLRANGAYTTHPLTGSAYEIIYLDTRDPLFNDEHVREALRDAIDVPALLAASDNTSAAPAIAGIPPGSWAYTKTQAPEHDAAAAARLLDDAGWTRDGDGTRSKNGTPLSFDLSITDTSDEATLAAEIARQWRAVGVEVNVQKFDTATFVSDQLIARKFQAALATVDPGPDPDPYPLWHSSQAAAPGRNLSGYSDPRIDDALERARQTTDTQRRKDLYALFQGIFLADVPSLPLFSPASVYVQNSRVHGFQPSLLLSPQSRFDGVTQWYIDTRVE